MHRIATLVVVAALTVATALPAQAQVLKPTGERPKIQMAILLDTSNSMDGLIDQARSQLWRIVNEFVSASREGRRPILEVALYEYGNSRLSASSGYIRKVLPFTTDLDRVSEELFALKTQGGSEYCGNVIQDALEELSWSAKGTDLKVVYIAGNEPFTQGPVDYRRAARAAIARGIMINTIHCGTFDEGIRGKWQDGAMLADGAYLAIDQDRKVAHIAAPQDAEIARLGAELNRTYVSYGSEGRKASARQEVQDGNASASGAGSAVARSVFKASRGYANPHWDLVDADDTGAVDLAEVEEEALPEEMREMKPAERKAFVAKKRSERKRIQAEIRKLEEDRKAYVAKKQAEAASEKKADTLDAAVIKSLRKQAIEKKFEFAE